MPVKHIDSEEQFDDLVTTKNSGYTHVIVDFYADWCGPCKRFSPTLENLSKEFTNVLFVKVNVDEIETLSDRYKVTAMPTFQLFRVGSLDPKTGYPSSEYTTVCGASEDKVRALLGNTRKVVEEEDF